MICPRCRGEKEMIGIGCPGCKLVVLPCEACHGAGEVDARYPEWLARGEQVQAWRRAAHLVLGDAAPLLGLSVITLSRIERGLDDPAPAETAIAALTRGADA